MFEPDTNMWMLQLSAHSIHMFASNLSFVINLEFLEVLAQTLSLVQV